MFFLTGSPPGLADFPLSVFPNRAIILIMRGEIWLHVFIVLQVIECIQKKISPHKQFCFQLQKQADYDLLVYNRESKVINVLEIIAENKVIQLKRLDEKVRFSKLEISNKFNIKYCFTTEGQQSYFIFQVYQSQNSLKKSVEKKELKLLGEQVGTVEQSLSYLTFDLSNWGNTLLNGNLRSQEIGSRLHFVMLVKMAVMIACGVGHMLLLKLLFRSKEQPYQAV